MTLERLSAINSGTLLYVLSVTVCDIQYAIDGLELNLES